MDEYGTSVKVVAHTDRIELPARRITICQSVSVSWDEVNVSLVLSDLTSPLPTTVSIGSCPFHILREPFHSIFDTQTAFA